MDCVDDKLGVPEKKRPHNTKPENVKNSEWGAKSVSNKNYPPQAPPSSVSGYYFPGGFQFKSKVIDWVASSGSTLNRNRPSGATSYCCLSIETTPRVEKSASGVPGSTVAALSAMGTAISFPFSAM